MSQLNKKERADQLRRLLDQESIPTVYYRPEVRKGDHALRVFLSRVRTIHISITETHYVVHTPDDSGIDTATEIFARTPWPETAATRVRALWDREG